MELFPFEEKNFLGNRLRELRLFFGYKQEDIARTLNVSRSTYSYYETGATRPDPAVLGKLARYYDLPIDVFYEDLLQLNVPLRDPEGHRKRTPRLGAAELDRIAELMPEERSLILFLRSTRISAKDLLTSLENAWEEEQASKNAE